MVVARRAKAAESETKTKELSTGDLLNRITCLTRETKVIQKCKKAHENELCRCVYVSRGGDTIRRPSLETRPFPCHPNRPSLPGSAWQLQGCSLQQWCPYTTHYLEGFSLSRCCSGRKGVKLRCKERPVSVGSLSLSHYSWFTYRITPVKQRGPVWWGGALCSQGLHSVIPTYDQYKDFNNMWKCLSLDKKNIFFNIILMSFNYYVLHVKAVKGLIYGSDFLLSILTSLQWWVTANCSQA